ncbi:MAG TPA: FAD-dependent oxidoreductase [Paraburkholderia sp.]|jgi:NADPH-dependent 2,4-dienoyl-CoA reductase/sulfur reductase-like enzyme/nitrite reductase/ring-hydroxylating ferredoxin subunit|nr:FAD-dependent oxidoreductase [Paraburkholderia sp.]
MSTPAPMHKVAALADLEDARPRRVELHDTPILLIRSGTTVHALGANCPHAGAPLEQGAVCHGHLICPWHNGTFEIASGALVEPPPLQPLPRYPVKIERGDVLVGLTPEAPSTPALTRDNRADLRDDASPATARVFAIVGAGAAGAAACAALREFGCRERIVLIDAEPQTPYDRTSLSKFVPSGEMQAADVPPLLPDAFFDEQRIERLHARVTRLDAERREIEFDAHPPLRYDAALVATGGVPKMPPLDGADDPAVKPRLLLLRNRADAERVAGFAEPGKRAVVLGSSFIGLEIASSLAKRKVQVTVVSPQRVPFEKQMGAELGRVFMRLHEAHGTTFRMNTQIEGVAKGAPLDVRVSGGDTLACDFVVIGTGVTPATGFIRGVARNDDGSLDVDASMRAAEHLYAAGDLARFPFGDNRRVRIEHWRVAQQHARAAARAMLGLPAQAAAPPFFWTYHFDRTFSYLGHPQQWDETAILGELDAWRFIALLCKHGYVAGVLGCGRDADIGRLAEAMREPLSRADAERLIERGAC